MEFSFEGEAGIALALVGLFGAGAIMIAPTHTWIGWMLIAIALSGVAGLILHHLGGRLPIRTNLTIAGAIITGIAFITFVSILFWPGPHDDAGFPGNVVPSSGQTPTAPGTAQGQPTDQKPGSIIGWRAPIGAPANGQHGSITLKNFIGVGGEHGINAPSGVDITADDSKFYVHKDVIHLRDLPTTPQAGPRSNLAPPNKPKEK